MNTHYHLVTSLTMVLCGLSRKNCKGYCYPSQDKLLVLLGRYHGLRCSRRTLNRVLCEMERAGYFRRIRRIRRGADGRLLFASTVYVLGRAIYRLAGVAAGAVRRALHPVVKVLGGGAGGEGPDFELGLRAVRGILASLGGSG